MKSSKPLVLALAACLGLQAQAQRDTLSRTLADVSVTGTRSAVSTAAQPEAVTIVPEAKLKENFRPNVLQTLSEQVPGLFVTGRGLLGYGVSDGAAGGIGVRGMGSGAGRVLVLIDGHPQYMGLFSHSISDSYQTLLAREVQVVRGPESVIYGSNAMGGVVNILTPRLAHNGSESEANVGFGSYGTLQSSFSNRTRVGKFSSTFAASYDRTDGHRPRLGFEQYGGYAKLGYDFAPHWQASADLDLTHFNAHYPGATSAPVYGAKQWITRGVTTAVVSNRYERASGALSFFYNWGRHKINDGHEADEPAPTTYFRSNDQMLGLSLYENARLFAGNTTTVGFDYQHVGGKARNTDIATGHTTARLVDKKEDIVAGYVVFAQRLWQRLTVDAGLRLDHNSHLGSEWVPKAGLAWDAGRGSTLRATVSKGFRNPSIRELYMFRPANPDLKQERLWNYEVGYALQALGGRLHADLSLFYLNADNLIQVVMGQSGPRNVNTGRVENFGLEASARYRFSDHFSANANYSALHMNHHVLASPEHKLYVGANYEAERWALVGGLQWVEDLFTAVSPDVKENFWLLNLTASYRLCKAVRLFAKGENLLGQHYEINRGYPMPKATFMGGVRVSF